VDKNKFSITSWIHAMRLRTLPLAFSTSITGAFYAYKIGMFSMLSFILTLSTTLLLQILSNFANDYGDFTKGTDLLDRQGPKRMVSSGEISPKQMKIGIAITIVLTLISGISLLLSSFSATQLVKASGLFLIGLLSIWAAIKYTVGKSAYGYRGLGDIFVFIFFGFVGVGGSFFIHTHSFNTEICLLSISIGLFSAGVLNINNLRDYENDKNAGKQTTVVKLGTKKGFIYHIALIITALLSIVSYYVIVDFSNLELLPLITFPLFIVGILKVKKAKEPKMFNSELKNLALSTFLFSLLFSSGIIIT